MHRPFPALLALVLCLAGAPPAGAVVGGVPAREADHPWFVTLPGCGGTLIAPDRVVTAAHCVTGHSPADLDDLRIGGTTVRARAAWMALHPDWVAATEAGDRSETPADVAVIALAAPVAGVRPLPIAEASALRAGVRADILGRGDTTAGASGTRGGLPGLRRATLEILTDAACTRYYRGAGKWFKDSFEPRDMLCAGDPDGRRPYRSGCYRDSGGPLVVGRGARRALAGVVSWGRACGRLRDPSVFADAAHHRGFLTEPAPVPAAIPGAAPTITGEPRPGATLRCEVPPFAFAPGGVRVGWNRIQGRRVRKAGSGPTYRIRAQDAGALLTCVGTGDSPGGDVSAPAARLVRVPR